MQVNRYTQMPAPLMINPLSFEELSRVPLAKAQASAEGVAALGKIKTDYNVDDKDLDKISTLVKGIDEHKDKVVESISTTGVTSQTVNEVLNLKKNRDQVYKGVINQAEENKKRIDLWKNQVDEMVMNQRVPAWYANLIKSNVYDKGWKGSFDEGSDVPKTFQGNFGEKYIDMDADIREVLFQAASKGDVKTTAWGSGEPSVEQKVLGDQGFNFMTTSGGGTKTVATNKKNLEEAIKMLESEYTDPTTERGKFSAYVGTSKEELKGIIEKYKNIFLDTRNEVRTESKTRQLMDGKGNNQVTAPIAYDTQAFRESAYKLLSNLEKTNPTTSLFMNNAWKESKEEVNKSTTQAKKDSNVPDVLTDMLGFGVKVQKFLRKMTGFGTSTPINTDEQIDVINRFGAVTDMLIKTGDLKPITLYNASIKGERGNVYRNEVIEKIRDYTDTHVNPIEAPNLVTEDYMRTTYGLANKGIEPGEASRDIVKGAPNFIRFEDRENIDASENAKEHTEILKAINSGKAEVQGVIPMLSPDLLDANGNYIKDMSSARAVYVTDKDSKYFNQKYYTKLPASLRNTPNFRRIEGINNTVMSLEVGQTSQDINNPLFVINETGQPEQVAVMHELAPNLEGKLVPGNYFMYRSNGQRIQLNGQSGEQWLPLMHTKESLLEAINKK